MVCVEKFTKIYGCEPDGVEFCPYRICPIGAHIDHQKGKITGFAINKGINIAYRVKRNGVVELSSLQFDKRAQWHINGVPKSKEGDWADYLRGATLALSKEHPLEFGLCGVIEGSLPIGGLSSSAALVIAFLSALCKVNHIFLSDSELISLALSAENDYVGVNCGRLDQSCEIYSKKDHLLYLDLRDDSYELIPQSPAMKPYKIGIFFSGVERTLIKTKYNTRIDECRAAAYTLKTYAGIQCESISTTVMRDVPLDVYQQYRNRLPETFVKRADHFYTEMERVEKGVRAWRDGDIERFGQTSFDSGWSSVVNWETGSDELKKMYEILRKTDGIYGARFSGAGIKGCCMALIDPSYEEYILENVKREYLDAFPLLKANYSAHICESANGVGSMNGENS